MYGIQTPIEFSVDYQQNSILNKFDQTLEIVKKITKKTEKILDENKKLKHYNLFFKMNEDLTINVNNNKNKESLSITFNNYEKLIKNKLKEKENYNISNLSESLNLRNEIAKMIYDNLDVNSIENGINIKNSIFTDILTDMKFQEKQLNNNKVNYYKKIENEFKMKKSDLIRGNNNV